MSFSSTPSLTEFDPTVIPYQYRVIEDVRQNFDYTGGKVHEVLLSGSVGSAKSILAAHIGITHCMANPRARLCLCRNAMPDLKDTILAKCLEHMEGDLIEGEDYEHNETKGKIEFYNGSEIISRSWHDKKYKKFRSVELSAGIVEELTENNEEDKQAYTELRMRVGRLPHVKESFIISATNPDSPAHWAYKYFIESTEPTRHVYYSVTTDNPFLPPEYVNQLLKDLDSKMAQRMVYGKWIEINAEVIYYAYEREHNFRGCKYHVDYRAPVEVSFDFNIGEGKPMSCCLYQYYGDTFHFYTEAVVHGARTEDILEELASRGELDHPIKYIIHGDATGKARSAASKRSNYDVIREFLDNYRNKNGQRINYEMQVPLSNPPIRTRHNKVNAYIKNAVGERRVFVYAGAPVLDEGFRLSRLRDGGQYIEDDSKAYQHITTAAGYGIMSTLYHSKRQPQGTMEL